MTTKTRVPALGADGWFTPDADEPTLLGRRCTACGTFVFPKADYGCPNPSCSGTDLVETPLSRRGTIWSYTDAQYQPPAPYVVPGDEHEPFCIAAVHLENEGLTVMGQVVAGVGIDDLTVGQEMELVVDVLYSDDEHDYLVWKWAPVGGSNNDENEETN